MSFHSPLDFLLRAYRAMEDREQAALQALSKRLAHAVGEFETCATTRRQLENEIRNHLEEGLHGAGLHFQRECDNAIRRRSAIIEASIRQLTTQMDAQRKALLDLRRRREVVESLRNQQFAIWQLDQRRREQKILDELFLIRQRHALGKPHS